MHLHIYKTSSCWAVFFWPTAFFDFCMTSESYPYHLKVAASAFVCVLFFPSLFTSFIILPINQFNIESQTPEEWKKTMQVSDYQLFSVEKRTKISSATFCLWNTTIRLGPHTLLFRISCWQGRATGRAHLPEDQVSDKLRWLVFLRWICHISVYQVEYQMCLRFWWIAI